MTLWLFGYLALEWLFHATKPSLVSSASGPVRLFLLLAAPAAFLAWLLPAQVILATVDALRREARSRWLAALLPAAIATVLILMLAENFTRTVFDYSVSDSRGAATALYLAAFLFVALWMWQRQALALAMRTPRRATVAAAAALALVSTVVALASRLPTSQMLAAVTHQDDAARRPNILLVGFDGVTASRTPAYGAAGSTPHLDSLVRRGILFENAFSNAGRTYSSVTSLLTGKLPIETSLFVASILDGAESVEHLPLLLRSAGYTNVQVGIEMHVDANDANMRGGFETVNGRPGLPGRARRDISKVRDRLELYRAALVKRVADRVPHILLLRTMHDEYRFLVGEHTDVPHFADPRRIELSRAFIEERRQPWFLHVHLLRAHGCKKGCTSALTETDASLGQLIAALRATQQLERTLIIVYSDHSATYGATERLLLVIAPPGELPPRRVRNNAQLLDVAPTILDYLGLPKAPWMSGVSLLADEPPPGRPIISLSPFEEATRSAGIVVCDRWGTIDFATWTFRSGSVAGHTAPCADGGFEQRGRAMLLESLRRNGYLSNRSR